MSGEYMIFYSKHPLPSNYGADSLSGLRDFEKEMKKSAIVSCKTGQLISGIVKLDKNPDRKLKILQMTENEIMDLNEYDRDIAMTWKKIFFGYDWHIVNENDADDILPLIDDGNNQLMRFK